MLSEQCKCAWARGNDHECRTLVALRAIVTWRVVSGCTHPDSAACNLVADQGQIRVDLTAGAGKYARDSRTGCTGRYGQNDDRKNMTEKAGRYSMAGKVYIPSRRNDKASSRSVKLGYAVRLGDDVRCLLKDKEKQVYAMVTHDAQVGTGPLMSTDCFGNGIFRREVCRKFY